jgi:hypothetical protein
MTNKRSASFKITAPRPMPFLRYIIMQFNLFNTAPAAHGDLIGLKVKLDRPADRDQPCCRNICMIGPGRGPHAYNLRCSDCGQHRGWLRKSTAAWIEHVVTRFGAPTTPIIVRRATTFEEEVPGTDTDARTST